MRFWKEELKKYDRRLKKIEENPDPTKLKSNQLLYQIWRDYRYCQLQAWEEGKPFAYTGGGVPFKLIKAMGLRSCSLGIEGDKAGKLSEKYFATVRKLGYPDHGCDRIMSGLGMVLAQEMPEPAIVFAGNYPCDPEHLSAEALRDMFGCPSFAIDIPGKNDDWALGYVTGQLRDLIKFIEQEIPGTKYNEDTLKQFHQLWSRQQKALRDVYELKKNVPCPIAAIDTFRLPPFEIVDDERVAQYSEMYRDELVQRVQQGYSPVKEEKLRIAWLVSGPFIADPWSFLSNLGVAVPFFEFGMAGYTFGFSQSDPWKEASDRGELTPLEEEARFGMTNSWSGSADRRIADLLKVSEDLKIDALVHYQLWGCSPLLASSKLLADRAEEELGIPSLFLEGSSLDENRLDFPKLKARLGDFVAINLEQKK
ncbi:MAG: 2-hydroxyacyl-CoA dehydratase family protein [SAR324 cluster bacterium]|nr:2-hydroxyacyl-CoA dehydratase family protein [SAR324 cluster bacterium]